MDGQSDADDGLGVVQNVFNALLESVSSSPQEMHLLCILRYLLQLDRENVQSDVAWQLAERLVQRATLVESQAEVSYLLQLDRENVQSDVAWQLAERLVQRATLVESQAEVSYLLQLDRENVQSDVAWQLAERLVQRATLVESQAEVSYLLQLDRENVQSDVAWQLAERLVQRATLVESQAEADTLLRLHSSRTSLTSCCCDCHQRERESLPIASVTSSAPIAPPPPPALLLSHNRQEKTAETLGDAICSGSYTLKHVKPANVEPSSKDGPDTPNSSGRLSSGVILTPSLIAKHMPQPKKKMKNFTWNKVPACRVQESTDNLWSRAVWRRASQESLQIDFDQLESWFGQDQQVEPCPLTHAPSVSSLNDLRMGRNRQSNGDNVNLLNPKRSLNVNIFLKQFKNTTSELLHNIRNFNADQIGYERLKGLVKILPREDELEALQTYKDESTKLGNGEKFFLQLIEVECYKLRVEAMLFKEEFVFVTDYAKPAINLMAESAQDIQSDRNLHDLMHLVLLAGNYLNSGSYSGNAAGFRMASLWKLADIKANRPKTTFLHFVAMEAERLNPKILHLGSKFSCLHEASKLMESSFRLSLETIRNDIQSLQERFSRISEQMKRPGAEAVANYMRSFSDFAKLELANLKSCLSTAESLRVSLSTFLCEEGTSFKLEECFSVFDGFIRRFVQAANENKLDRFCDTKEAGGGDKSLSETSNPRRWSSAMPSDVTLTHYFSTGPPTPPARRRAALFKAAKVDERSLDRERRSEDDTSWSARVSKLVQVAEQPITPVLQRTRSIRRSVLTGNTFNTGSLLSPGSAEAAADLNEMLNASLRASFRQRCPAISETPSAVSVVTCGETPSTTTLRNVSITPVNTESLKPPQSSPSDKSLSPTDKPRVTPTSSESDEGFADSDGSNTEQVQVPRKPSRPSRSKTIDAKKTSETNAQPKQVVNTTRQITVRRPPMPAKQSERAIVTPPVTRKRVPPATLPVTRPQSTKASPKVMEKSNAAASPRTTVSVAKQNRLPPVPKLKEEPKHTPPTTFQTRLQSSQSAVNSIKERLSKKSTPATKPQPKAVPVKTTPVPKAVKPAVNAPKAPRPGSAKQPMVLTAEKKAPAVAVIQPAVRSSKTVPKKRVWR